MNEESLLGQKITHKVCVHEDALTMDLFDIEIPPELPINVIIICFFTKNIVPFKKRRKNKSFPDKDYCPY